MSKTMVSSLSKLQKIVCIACEHEMSANHALHQCEACGSPWLKAIYAYDEVATAWKKELTSRPNNLWRYAELMPVENNHPELMLHEGMTPLIKLHHLDAKVKDIEFFTKDDRRSPTNSFKDRQAALAVLAMKLQGIEECVMASAGNASIAYAAYCARAGIKLWIFVSSRVPNEKMREASLYGAKVVKVSDTYDEAKKIAAEFASHREIYLERGSKSIPSKESMKTIAFEIAEQLAMNSGTTDALFQAPDWYIQAVSGGIGPLGVWKGFEELKKMGFIDKMPKLGIIQVEGCSPMVNAFVADKDTAEAIQPSTLITVLSTGDPGFAYTQLFNAVKSNDGTMLSVSDAEAFEAMRQLAKNAGLSVEPATAVAFAGIEKMIKQGLFKTGDCVVINSTGHTMPVESYILDDQHVLELEIQRNKSADTQNEGLTTAFESLSEQFTTILLIDDNPSDRRLIKKLLQRYKKYRIHEADNGKDGLEMAREVQPDLIVTDLTMPEMDGFEFLENIKHDAQMANIPVVVVSAKSLTPSDQDSLDKYSDSVWTKGNFTNRQLTQHVVELLGGTPIDVIQQEPKPPPKVTDADILATQSEQKKSANILVIDDDQRHRRLVKRLLETSGNQKVLEAETGEVALKMVDEHTVDLILLDLIMPTIDGFTVLEKLQSNPEHADIPIVVMSGKDLDKDEREKLRDHIRTLVKKSAFDRKQFLAIIDQTLHS